MNIDPEKVDRRKVSIYRLLRLYSKYYEGDFIENIILQANEIDNDNLQQINNMRICGIRKAFRRRYRPSPVINFGQFRATVYHDEYPYIVIAGKYPILDIDMSKMNGPKSWLIPSLMNETTDICAYHVNDPLAEERAREARCVYMNSGEIMAYLCEANITCFQYFVEAVLKLCTLSEFLTTIILLPEYILSDNDYANFLTPVLDNDFEAHYCTTTCDKVCVVGTNDTPDTDMLFQSYDGEQIGAHRFIMASHSKMIRGILENYPDGVVPLPMTGNVIKHVVISIYTQKISILNTLSGLHDIEQTLELLDMMCVVDKDVVLEFWINHICV